MDVVIQKDESHRELIWDWNLTASAVKRLQSMNYQIRDSISYQERLTAIQELNAEIEKAILDEQDAQRMYEKMTALARKAGLDEKAIEIDLIRGQENNHERIFRDMGMDVDRIIERERTETNAPCPTTARPTSGRPIYTSETYIGRYTPRPTTVRDSNQSR